LWSRSGAQEGRQEVCVAHGAALNAVPIQGVPCGCRLAAERWNIRLERAWRTEGRARLNEDNEMTLGSDLLREHIRTLVDELLAAR